MQLAATATATARTTTTRGALLTFPATKTNATRHVLVPGFPTPWVLGYGLGLGFGLAIPLEPHSN